MGLAGTVVLGVVSAMIMYIGAHQGVRAHNPLTAGQFMSYVMFNGFMIAPVMQLVNVGDSAD